MAAVRKKSVALADLFIELVEAKCGAYGLTLESTRDSARRGSQISFMHEHGYQIMRALIERGVIGDFRAPSTIRFGFTPLYVGYADVWQAVEVLADILRSGAWKDARSPSRQPSPERQAEQGEGRGARTSYCRLGQCLCQRRQHRRQRSLAGRVGRAGAGFSRRSFGRGQGAGSTSPMATDRATGSIFSCPSACPKGSSCSCMAATGRRSTRVSGRILPLGRSATAYAVAMPSYTLCPEIRIAGIVREIGAAIGKAAAMVDGPLMLTGHSAGGHLASRMATQPRLWRPMWLGAYAMSCRSRVCTTCARSCAPP